MSNNPMVVKAIIEVEGRKKPIWRRVGTAFTNRDGSINVLLDAIPFSGKLNIREDDRDESERA